MRGVSPYDQLVATRRAGFTLIELLVVIGIISILAAILFPVFARAKASAKQTTCISNLRQIGAAITLYMAENDDLFPHAVDPSDKFTPQIWSAHPEFQARIPSMPMLHEALQGYLKSREVFKCPGDNGSRVLDNHPYIPFLTAPSAYVVYGTSYLFRTEIAFRYFSSTNFELPADVNVLFDSNGHWHSTQRAIQENENPQEVQRLLETYRYNTLFGDMHVKSLSYRGLQNAWSTPL